MKRKNKTGAVMVDGYNYTSRENRENTVSQLFSRAKSARSVVEEDWKVYDQYYNFIHAASMETAGYAEEQGLWLPPVVPDPWIAVESQIDPNVPEPEFRGRDSDKDSEKAKQREFAVKYIVENNRLSDMNTRNERRLLKYGDAFWKAYWDPAMRCGINEGDIRIKDIPVESIYPDPSVRDGVLQEGQYVDYVYRIHKVAFCQLFKRDLEKLGIAPYNILNSDYSGMGGLFDLSGGADETDDTMEVLEHWFRQPEDTRDEKGNAVPAGSIGCSIQAGGHEIRYIPNYWKRTHRQCQLFPFVHYWRIQDENKFWNKSELFPILGMVDAADRKLHMAMFSEAMTGNDIILVEDGALSEGEEIVNEPGSIVHVKQGRAGGVARLGGLQAMTNALNGMEWFRTQMERANRNYETNLGKESSRATTAAAMSMLRSDAQDQEDIKKADRNAGFERLYELLDWLALEFFDDDRLLYLGADDRKNRDAQQLSFNSDSLSDEMPEVRNLRGEVVRDPWQYWPRVDVTITAGDSVVKGKQATLQALQALTQSQITPENWKLYAAQLDLLDIPNKQEIIDEWKTRFDQQAQLQQMQMAMQQMGVPQTPAAQMSLPGGGRI